MSMESKAAFGGTLLRLKEAQNQRVQFRRKWAAHLADVPYEFSLESDTALDHRLMGHEKRTAPPDLGLHFGMWLQQQRAALDNALYACVGLRQNSFPPARENLIEFPIVESLGKFRATKTIKNDVVDLEVAEFLEGHQPYRHYYKGKEQDPHLSPLYWLNELARVDRHRVMHVGVGSMQISRNLFLYGGAEHKVTHVVEEGHLLTGSTCLVAFSTAQQLRSRKFRFHEKPQILPEISEWSQAKWNIYVFGHWDEPDPGYVQGYVPLDVRMSDIEKTVIDICGGLARHSGLNRFFDSVESSVYSRPFDYQPTKYWGEDPAQRRRVNGL
ncbi:hypothetical protein [Arthrobacter sp. zg-Y179]|uniref:hypothetical protein n=1 Tax=Arthrobacter sp. zg-Y179 TaxID=2894188 RepID=UPI001E3B6E33|nr:hypothetical protein [Arthrobacter sp. zg-Y179]MCC9173804.1 hypothetical protein [Arthrobacter sp. zg-Y179]